MMLRGIGLPEPSRRYPVSISCVMSVLISNVAPFLISRGRKMRAVGMLVFSSAAVEAGGERHHHLGIPGPMRAVAHGGDGGDSLRRRQPYAGRYLGDAGARPEMKAHHGGNRVLLREHR